MRPERALAVLRTPEGKKLLEYLERNYQQRKLYNESATKMAYNCGQFDLVEDLKTQLENAKHE